ncbi:hypothetical protein DFH09DRAFT_557605 [Mycena vulgaris]|nr:hypothetical protein DFH09DRAFT_557605 [Mycena vulgaris]
MTNLLKCHLWLLDTPVTSSQDEIVKVPKLRKLYLCGSAFATLILPALEDLFISSLSPPHPQLLPWLRRSRCRLRRIAFSDVDSAEVIIQLFQQFPTIKEITIDISATTIYSITITNSILLKLASIDSTSGCTLPNLERIAIYFSGPCIGFDSFTDLIKARRPANPQTAFLPLTAVSENLETRDLFCQRTNFLIAAKDLLFRTARSRPLSVTAFDSVFFSSIFYVFRAPPPARTQPTSRNRTDLPSTGTGWLGRLQGGRKPPLSCSHCQEARQRNP